MYATGQPLRLLCPCRYQSLQRSFRRSERPNIQVRNRSVFSNVRGGRAAGDTRTENNSLSLTLAEAEEMAHGLSSHGRKSKKQQRTNVRSWFRKSKSKSISQQSSVSSGDDVIRVSPGDDVIRVSPASSSIEGSPQPEGVSDSLSRSSGSESGSGNRSASGEHTTVVPEGSASRASHERELTPASIRSVEFESGTEDEQTSPDQTSPSRSARLSNLSDRLEEGMEPLTGGASPIAESASGSGLRDRQTSIVHASNLTVADSSAAARARLAASNKRRQRLDTDEITNGVGE